MITYKFFYPSFSLWSFAPTSVPFPSVFRMLNGMTLPFTLTPTVLLQRNTFSLSSAAVLFTSLALNVAKFSIPSDRIKRHPKAWWSVEVEEAVSERRKVFAALTGVIKIARLTSPLHDVLCPPSQRLRLRHGRRLALLSRPIQTLNLYILLFGLSLALFPHLSPLLGSPNRSSHRESASVFELT